MPDKKNEDHLKYGDGQREQYGEGADYRPEDKTKAADQSNDSGGFAGGDGKDEKGATSRKMPNKP